MQPNLTTELVVPSLKSTATLTLSGNLQQPTERPETTINTNRFVSDERIGFHGSQVISGALAMSASLRKAMGLHPLGTTARRLQDNPVIGIDMLETLKEVALLFPAHASSLGARIYTTILLAEPTYKPVATPFTNSEAALVGSLLDSDTLEQGEPA